ncbi:MAG: DEAD/DEAH box helicase [Anaerolineae bacterium]
MLGYKSILHGTWIARDGDSGEELFFIWAERDADAPLITGDSASRPRIRRHPHAATTIEIADLLADLVPAVDWRSAQRLTRVAYLPSTSAAPVAAGWLYRQAVDLADETASIEPWRIEGLSVPMPQLLPLLITLPLAQREIRTVNRLGNDLLYWGGVAKFALELLARQRFLPGLAGENGSMRAVWLPVIDGTEDGARFDAFAHAMPPACRALLPERDARNDAPLLRPQAVLDSFMKSLVDSAVREWGFDAGTRAMRAGSIAHSKAASISSVWWQGLGKEADVRVSQAKTAEIGRFYQAWRNWTYKAKSESGSSFRLCFRLEPPAYDPESDRVVASHWTLRYFLQAIDDPSLLVPAWEVWRERGDVLSYLNRRFDNPQEKLLEGLGIAAELCPAIRRSLKGQSPDATTLTDQEAFQFLREVSRLLEGAGFGVMIPPWWNTPDTRLRVRAVLHAAGDAQGSGVLNMNSIISYDWEMALGDETLSREEFERLAALKTPLVQVRGRWVLLQPDQIESVVAFWEKHRGRGMLELRDALALALGAQDELDGLPVTEVQLDDTIKDVLARLTRTAQLELLPAPEGFSGELRPYQVQGLSWLVFLRRWGFGACLADDMGLGKTIQAIALVLEEKKRTPDLAPTLVVCPTSLVGNWQREVARFAPGLKTVVHHGTGRAEGSAFVEQALASDLVISTYGLVRRDLKDLVQVRWANVIIDEAQNIKNPATKQARAARRLQADFRLALTGTPVENRLSELWSIMAFLNPGYLGARGVFRREFSVPIERFQDSQAADKLRRLVRPFVLRRLKNDPEVIRDLPDKFEQKIFCNLTREQATLYEAIVQSGISALPDGEEAARMQRRGMVLAMLTRLKQVCNHPSLFLADGSAIGQRSGKLNRLTEMLEEILDMGERALIFTQYAQMGFLLQNHLRDTYGQEVLFLHGGTPQRQRDRMLERFQESDEAPGIFVLSLKAGGTGLNLMRANHVFHYDRWWNPAVENQATDRAYRIGQTRDVQVHKFVCLGTLEERIDALIESKRELADAVIGQGDSWVTELTTDQLYDLVTLRSEAVETD